MEKVELTEYTVYKEDNQLYLKLTYTIEDEHRIIKKCYPKVRLDILTYKAPHTRDIDYPISMPRVSILRDVAIDFGLREYMLERGDACIAKNVYFVEEVISEKPKELTLEEIEKKLGYKVKIISKEKEN